MNSRRPAVEGRRLGFRGGGGSPPDAGLEEAFGVRPPPGSSRICWVCAKDSRTPKASSLEISPRQRRKNAGLGACSSFGQETVRWRLAGSGCQSGAKFCLPVRVSLRFWLPSAFIT
jgi:hypothetical protein